MVFSIKKLSFFLLLLFLGSCSNYGQLKLITDLPNFLKEVSGTQTVKNSTLIWMLNDGGNPNKIYGFSTKGKFKKEIIINAKNHDWEDLTSDDLGNLYIGDFGNNRNDRKNLVILKINSKDLSDTKNTDIERIKFQYPNQHKFPPKKKHLYFDTESFFFYNDSIYLFTRSRVKDNYGKTSLYKIPAIKGNHTAEFISEFTFCNELKCSITSAAISPDNKKIVLLTSNTILLFTNFKGEDFFSGKVTQLPLNHKSQKEGVCFKDDYTLFITDERSHARGGNLYEFTF